MVENSPPVVHNKSSLERSTVSILVRLGVLIVGVSASVVVGVAIAIWRPNWIWQPSLPNFNSNSQYFTLSADALFDPSNAIIRTEAYALLDQVAAQLPVVNGRSDIKVRVMSYTDAAVAAGAANQSALNLSYQRAVSVRDYLMRLRGEQTYHWIAVGYGSSHPLGLNDSTANRQASRRIEIVVNK